MQKKFIPMSHRKADAKAHIDATAALNAMQLKAVRLASADSDGAEDRPDGFPFTRN